MYDIKTTYSAQQVDAYILYYAVGGNIGHIELGRGSRVWIAVKVRIFKIFFLSIYICHEMYYRTSARLERVTQGRQHNNIIMLCHMVNRGFFFLICFQCHR